MFGVDIRRHDGQPLSNTHRLKQLTFVMVRWMQEYSPRPDCACIGEPGPGGEDSVGYIAARTFGYSVDARRTDGHALLDCILADQVCGVANMCSTPRSWWVGPSVEEQVSALIARKRQSGAVSDIAIMQRSFILLRAPTAGGASVTTAWG